MKQKLPPHSRTSGFTLFELIVVIIVVAVLSGILLGRFLTYQELSEKTAMEQTAGAIRSALTIQMAGLITHGRAEDIAKLADVNPITLLMRKQKNYVGEFYEPDLKEISPGSWYFDLKQRQLVYLIHQGRHFLPDRSGVKRVRYRINVVYNEAVANGSNKNGKRNLGGVILEEVEPYIWDVR